MLNNLFKGNYDSKCWALCINYYPSRYGNSTTYSLLERKLLCEDIHLNLYFISKLTILHRLRTGTDENIRHTWDCNIIEFDNQWCHCVFLDVSKCLLVNREILSPFYLFIFNQRTYQFNDIVDVSYSFSKLKAIITWLYTHSRYKLEISS